MDLAELQRILRALVDAVDAAGALGPAGAPPEVAFVIVPGATQGSLVLAEALRANRARLQAPVAFWPRIAQGLPRRRRVFRSSEWCIA